MGSFEDQRILNLAEAGYNISKTGLSRISLDSYISFRFSMNQIHQLEQMRLVSLDRIADLNQIGVGTEKQFDWNLRDWEKAIRNHLDLETEYFENDNALRLARNGFRITETDDGGYNLDRWYAHIKYYRNRKSAINRALKIIATEKKKGL